MREAFERHATLIRVIDGDTVVADVDLGFFAHYIATLRVMHVNTPERGQPGYAAASLATRAHLAMPFMVRTFKPDKYGGRWDAEIELSDGTMLHERLIADNHGVPYEGGAR